MSQARFVHIVDEVPELDAAPDGDGPVGDGPVLLVGLDGFLDAGNAAALAIAQITTRSTSDEGRVVASFEVDEFYDYRARRPALSFVEDRYAGYDAPRLVVRLHRDQEGTPFLALTGPEPDIRWEAFAQAVRAVVEHFEVRLVVSLGAIPMAVPHTRPVQVTNHATHSGLLVQENLWRGEIRVPSSAQSLLELRLGEWGLAACGFVAHIPHYVAAHPYPDAALALVDRVGELTGLRLTGTDLVEAAETTRAQIAEQVAGSAEIADVVSGLEQQYDAFHSARDNLLEEGEPLPSGEELGAQFEQFLAGLDESGED